MLFVIAIYRSEPHGKTNTLTQKHARDNNQNERERSRVGNIYREREREKKLVDSVDAVKCLGFFFSA